MSAGAAVVGSGDHHTGRARGAEHNGRDCPQNFSFLLYLERQLLATCLNMYGNIEPAQPPGKAPWGRGHVMSAQVYEEQYSAVVDGEEEVVDLGRPRLE